MYASLSFLTVLLLSLLNFDSSILDTIQFLWISINCDCSFTIHGIQVPLYDPVYHSTVTSPSRANTQATWGSSSWNCWRPSAFQKLQHQFQLQAPNVCNATNVKITKCKKLIYHHVPAQLISVLNVCNNSQDCDDLITWKGMVNCFMQITNRILYNSFYFLVLQLKSP